MSSSARLPGMVLLVAALAGCSSGEIGQSADDAALNDDASELADATEQDSTTVDSGELDSGELDSGEAEEGIDEAAVEPLPDAELADTDGEDAREDSWTDDALDSEPPRDSAPLDSGAPDTFVADTFVADTFVADTFVADTRVADTRVADTFVADTRVADTATADTRVADTATADTRVADTATADTRVADTATADTSVADTAPADTAPIDAGPTCGDLKCEGLRGETCTACASDCRTGAAVCGNGECQTGETSASCQPDCGPATWATGWTDWEQQVITLVNGHRAAGTDCPTSTQAPVGALTLNTSLRRASRLHSWDQAYSNYFSHTSCNGRTFTVRAAAAGTTAGGEVIGNGYSSPSAMVAGWMASQGHCAILMSGGYTQIGIGYADVAGRRRWTGMVR